MYFFLFASIFLKYCGCMHVFLIYLKRIASCFSCCFLLFPLSTAVLRSTHAAPAASSPCFSDSIGYTHMLDLVLSTCWFFKVQLKVTRQCNKSCFHDLGKDEALHALDHDWNGTRGPRKKCRSQGEVSLGVEQLCHPGCPWLSCLASVLSHLQQSQ